MAKFNAATAVESLDYDFTAYKPDAVGVVPEPTTKQIQAYFDAVRNIAKTMQSLKSDVEQANSGNLPDEEVAAILSKMEELDIATYQDEMKDATVALCSGTPSREDLDVLPFRVLQAFMQWITGEFRPEGGAAIMRR